MKKLYSLLTAVCVLFMVGCGDDDNGNDNLAEKLSKEYSSSNLKLKVNEAPNTTSSTVDFKTVDLLKGDFVFKNLLPGENEIIVSGVSLDEKESGIYSFTGESKDSNREVTFTGSVREGELTLNATVKIVSKVANLWKPRNTTAVAIDITSATDAKINMHGLMGQNKEVPVQDGMNTVCNLLTIVLKDYIDFKINLKDNTSLIASWESTKFDIEKGSSEKTNVNYNVVNDKIYVTIDLSTLLPGLIDGGGLPSGITLEEIQKIVEGLSKGIPVDYEFDGEVLKAKFTKEILNPYLKLVPSLIGDLEDVEIPEIKIFGLTMFSKDILIKFLPEFINALDESTDFTLTLALSPVAAE